MLSFLVNETIFNKKWNMDSTNRFSEKPYDNVLRPQTFANWTKIAREKKWWISMKMTALWNITRKTISQTTKRHCEVATRAKSQNPRSRAKWEGIWLLLVECVFIYSAETNIYGAISQITAFPIIITKVIHKQQAKLALSSSLSVHVPQSHLPRWGPLWLRDLAWELWWQLVL